MIGCKYVELVLAVPRVRRKERWVRERHMKVGFSIASTARLVFSKHYVSTLLLIINRVARKMTDRLIGFDWIGFDLI